MINNLCEKYCKNISTYNELENYDYKHLESKQKVLDAIKENTAQKHAIFVEQNELLAQLYAITEDVDHIDSETYTILQDFARELSESELERDNAVAFHVRKALLAYGRNTNNYDIIVEEMYWCGICEWKYYKIDGIRPEISYFEQISDCEKYLPFITPMSRKRYMAGVINRLLYFTNREAGPLLKIGVEALDKLEQLEKDYPDTPVNFRAFRSIIYRNMLTVEKSFCAGIDKTPENTAFAYEIALKSMELMTEKNNTSVPFETVYYIDLYAAEFHAGIISIGTFLNKLEEFCVPDEKYSNKENYNRVFRNTSLYIKYLRLYSNCSKQEIEARAIEKVDNAFKFLTRIKRDEESHYISEYILQFVENTIEILPFELVREVLFRTTINQHKDTSIHNLMVEKISHVLLSEMLEKRPEELIGIMGFHTVEEILANREKILQVMEDMALIHDIGKYKCISIISNASRKLDNREFAIIKGHPMFGYEIIKKAPFYDALKDGVLLHHKWHNDQGGYPQEYSMTANRPLIDILSVADCLDAATDPYGRSYGIAKTLDDMMVELNDVKGTRYGEAVVELLQTPMVKLKINHLLNHTRNDMAVYICQKNYDKIINYYPEHMHKGQFAGALGLIPSGTGTLF